MRSEPVSPDATYVPFTIYNDHFSVVNIFLGVNSGITEYSGAY